MLTKLLTGERVRIGNPVAIARLTRLREFTDQLLSGEASRDDIPLTVAQIRASTTPRVRAGDRGLAGQPAGRSPRRCPARLRRAVPPGLGAARGRPTLVDVVVAGLRPERGGPARAADADVPLAAARALHPHRDLGQAREPHAHRARSRCAAGSTSSSGCASPGWPRPGLVSATRGNHGQSIAFAGRHGGLPVTIVVPEGNSPDKNAAMEGFGAELVVHGADFQAAREYAAELAEERGLLDRPLLPPVAGRGRGDVRRGAARVGARPRRGLRAGRDGQRHLRQHRRPRPARAAHRDRRRGRREGAGVRPVLRARARW